MKEVLLSIDIGSSSLRSALVTPQGKILKIDIEPITIWKQYRRMAQSSEQIYQSLVTSVTRLLESNRPFNVRGIGVDATASLVLLDQQLQALSLPDNPEANILGWMDHRSLKQTERINQYLKNHPEADYGKQIPEQNLPKILWLKEEQPDIWNQCGCLLDLYDYITWRLTGTLTRTDCSLTAKIPVHIREAFTIDSDLRFQGAHLPIGAAIPGGLSAEAASVLGLSSQTPVATGIIDGYGGSLAVLTPPDNKQHDLTRQLSMVVGTSTIYIASKQEATAIEGCWGPTPSVFPEYPHITVGQSAAGALIDFVIDSHPACTQAKLAANHSGLTIYEYLNRLLITLDTSYTRLTSDIHMLPYLAGNRCPRMDMSLTGIMTGLTLDDSEKNLAITYLCTVQAIALGARQNIERLQKNGFHLDTLMATGGLAKNSLFMQEHVNALGIQAILPQEPDAMLLAGAIPASVAAGVHQDISSAINVMKQQGATISPDVSLKKYYDRKYAVFLELHKDQQKYKSMMRE